CDPFNRQTPPPPPPSQGDARLDDLAQRIEKLKQWALFEVVNKENALIFRVSRGEARLYNKAGTVVAAMRANDQGGYFMGLSDDHRRVTTIGASGHTAGVLIDENDGRRVDLTIHEAGNASLVFPGENGPIAALGESRAGSGALVVGDAAGHKVASVT